MKPHSPRLPCLALSLLCTPLALAAPQQSGGGAAPEAQPAAPAAESSSAPSAEPAERAPSKPDTSPPVIPVGELELRYYTARHVEAKDLQRAIDRLATREFYVRNEDGTITGPVSNVRGFGDTATLVIYDRHDRVEQIDGFLSDLEAAAGDSGADADPGLQVAEYAPRHVPIESLYRALAPFQRQIRVPDSKTVQNVTVVDLPARLVLRDTPDGLKQMLALLEQIDAPAPQLMVHCWLIHGVDHEAAGELPAELVDNLRQLVPFAGFERESMAILRTSIVAGQELQLRGDFQRLGDTLTFQLELTPAGYDARTQLLTLARCAFKSSTGQQFATSAVVKLGEYVVLGAAGSDPLFVVLRALPAGG